MLEYSYHCNPIDSLLRFSILFSISMNICKSVALNCKFVNMLLRTRRIYCKIKLREITAIAG